MLSDMLQQRLEIFLLRVPDDFEEILMTVEELRQCITEVAALERALKYCQDDKDE